MATAAALLVSLPKVVAPEMEAQPFRDPTSPTVDFWPLLADRTTFPKSLVAPLVKSEMDLDLKAVLNGEQS